MIFVDYIIPTIIEDNVISGTMEPTLESRVLSRDS